MLYIECHRARVGLFQSRCLMNTEAATGGLFFNKVAGLKETLAQLFSYEFCEIFKNSFFIEHLQNIASMNTCQ